MTSETETLNFEELSLSEHIKLYTALSNERRIQILFALYRNPRSEGWMLSFNRLKEVLKFSPAALSHHLGILQDSGLVENPLVREGRTLSQYRLTEKGFRIVTKMLNELEERTNIT